MLIVIKGAGDLATGIACRLKRCGFQVVCTDIAKPTTVRCTVAFSRAVYDGTATVTGVTARLARDAEDARRILEAGEIPILIDPEYKEAKKLQPAVLVDAIIPKRISAPKSPMHRWWWASGRALPPAWIVISAWRATAGMIWAVPFTRALPSPIPQPPATSAGSAASASSALQRTASGTPW